MNLTGFRAIGRCIADLVIAAGIDVLAVDPYRLRGNGCVGQADVDSGLGCDSVVYSAHGTQKTERMMNHDAFAKLCGDASLIDISRGMLMDKEALDEALVNNGNARAGLLNGPGTDEQPNLRIAFLTIVVAVPHVARLTREATDHQAFETVRHIRNLIAAKLPGLVNGASPGSSTD